MLVLSNITSSKGFKYVGIVEFFYFYSFVFISIKISIKSNKNKINKKIDDTLNGFFF